MTTARLIYEDGSRWLRITPPDGFEYDEPVSGWQLVIHRFQGFAMWQHKDGRTFKDAP